MTLPTGTRPSPSTLMEEVIAATPGDPHLELCLQCGTCGGSCPSGPDMEHTPRALFAMIAAGMKDQVLRSNTPWYCVSCYYCTVRCPQEIHITDLMYTLKRMAIKEGLYRESNAADAPEFSETFIAQAAYEKMYETLGSKKINGRYEPVHYRLATHWARLIELLYAAERMLELSRDAEITAPNVRVEVTTTPDEGVGCVEAPRGTLTHHYWTDERGILTRVNLIVGTTNNYAPIAMSIKKAAQALIQKGTVVTEGLLNRIEMAFRAYDPCFACATHSLPGQMPLEVVVRDAQGEVVARLCQGF